MMNSIGTYISSVMAVKRNGASPDTPRKYDASFTAEALRLALVATVLLFLPGALFGQTATSSSWNGGAGGSEKCFRVIRIDSLNDQIRVAGRTDEPKYDGVYIIYAQRHDSLYKLVSKRVLPIPCRSIKAGNCYPFNLIRYGVRQPGDLPNLGPAEPESIILNGSLVKRERKSFYEVFYDPRVENLCFIPKQPRK